MSKTEDKRQAAQAAAAQPEAPSGPPPGYWEDARGNLVPQAKVKDLDKARDKAVRSLIKEAHKASTDLAAFKALAMQQVELFLAASASEYGVEMGGEKGNVTLMSFDGRYKVVRQISEKLAFDERLQVAKALIDECVHLWAKGANKNLQSLVNHAFQVDQEGKVNTSRVLALRSIKIEDAKWLQAMEAIADSMKTVSSKSYIRFYERLANGAYQPIALDVAAL
jgi:hypothetical protein